MAHKPHAPGLGGHDHQHHALEKSGHASRTQHGHSGHAHGHAGGRLDGIFALATALNLGFVFIETGFGFLSHSMALLADAGHNFSDVLGLVAAWAASILARRGPTQRYTYGLRSSSILAALLNAIILLIAVGGIAVEAVQRLLTPAPVDSGIVIAVALTGVAVNGISALLLARGDRGDLNVKSAFAHMLADLAAAPSLARHGAPRRAARYRRLRGAAPSSRHHRRRCGPRSSYLAIEHDHDSAYLPSCHAGWASG